MFSTYAIAGGLVFNGPTSQSNMFLPRPSCSSKKCANILITPSKLRFIAKRTVDYILGDNPLRMSYMVWDGAKFPQHIYDRGSSLPSIYGHPKTIQCNDGYNSSLNLNFWLEQLREGPMRMTNLHSEPTTYINAPLVGCLAYLARS
ncbi:hypothetical protein SUGI_0287010 [Cryptomeria japonica]|uniref:endoglucanase 2-like n=1 Tax=Cryptomeria japonica TaxID=3369 RepID=UPI002408EAC7|nr:endoglucanase 2-like [Cryptomeria japonica]GLJ16706.1 hypothetical protein SUGI_0287010 [Cryptomeria japonica]